MKYTPDKLLLMCYLLIAVTDKKYNFECEMSVLTESTGWNWKPVIWSEMQVPQHILHNNERVKC